MPFPLPSPPLETPVAADVYVAPAELLTKKELARRLRVSERKIEMDAALPRIRWNRTVRFDWEEVVRFLKKQNG